MLVTVTNREEATEFEVTLLGVIFEGFYLGNRKGQWRSRLEEILRAR